MNTESNTNVAHVRPRTDCNHCGDLGVHLVSSSDDNFETLMLCDCREGKNQRYLLPVWEYKYGKIFSRGRCPLKWFKPEMSVPEIVVPIGRAGQVKFEDSIQHKIDYWRAKIQLAEGYWKSAGQI